MKKIPKLLIFIFVIALFIRTFKLDMFPAGFHVDEAKVAWESLSIAKTAKDDHGNFLALYYNSFGDYRPTGILYATIPSLLIFGRTNFAVRFPSALLGSLTVIPVYFIAFTFEERIKKNKQKNRISVLGISAAFLFAIIPWSIATSRATSEVVISCFLILSAMALLNKKTYLSFILLAMSFFFYHSARVMGPTLMLVWIYMLREDIQKNKIAKKVLIGFFVTSILSIGLLLSPTGLARYNQVKLNKPSLRDIITQYTSYFDPNFFIGDIAKPFRYTTANVGIVSIPIFALFLLGVFLIIRRDKNKFLLLFFILSPLPAALTNEDSPNLHRAFFMMPFLIIIAAIGLAYLWENHKTTFKVFAVLFLLTFITFATNYLDTATNFAFQFRDPQTKRLSLYLQTVQNNYDKIYVTNDPDSPYPWFYFFNNIEPNGVNIAQQKNDDGKWQYQNIIWDNTKCPAGHALIDTKKDKSVKKILVVDNGVCFTDYKEKLSGEAKIIMEFSYNGKVNYRVWEYIPTRN